MKVINGRVIYNGVDVSNIPASVFSTNLKVLMRGLDCIKGYLTGRVFSDKYELKSVDGTYHYAYIGQIKDAS